MFLSLMVNLYIYFAQGLQFVVGLRSVLFWFYFLVGVFCCLGIFDFVWLGFLFVV